MRALGDSPEVASPLERHAVDIIQPDCTKCGGLTEAWRIGWMAYEHNVQWVPHGWNTALGLAADLQLASASAQTDMVEYLEGSPFIDEITVGGWRLDKDGMLPIPDKPGLGVEIDLSAVERHTGVRFKR